jgi:hypothetical protein
MMRLRSALLALAFVLALSSLGAAQSILSVSAGTSSLTSGDEVAPVGRLEFSHDLGDIWAVKSDVSYTHHDARNDTDLFLGNSTWGVRRHARGALAMVFTPLRFRDDGVENRLGLIGGAVVRTMNDERMQGRNVIPGSVLERLPDEVEDMAERRRAEGYTVTVFDLDDGAGDEPDGVVVAFTRSYAQTDLGAELGVRYEFRVDRMVAGADWSYTRFLIGGDAESHAADIAFRVGYRF